MLRFILGWGLVGVVLGCGMLSGFVSDALAGGTPVLIEEDGEESLTAIGSRFDCFGSSCTKEDGTTVTVYRCFSGGFFPSCSGTVGPNCAYSCTVSGGAAK